jgi:hypothetical protein
MLHSTHKSTFIQRHNKSTVSCATVFKLTYIQQYYEQNVIQNFTHTLTINMDSADINFTHTRTINMDSADINSFPLPRKLRLSIRQFLRNLKIWRKSEEIHYSWCLLNQLKNVENIGKFTYACKFSVIFFSPIFIKVTLAWQIFLKNAMQNFINIPQTFQPLKLSSSQKDRRTC